MKSGTTDILQCKTTIKQLARQAGLIAPYGSDREGLANFDYVYFANLVVAECADICVQLGNQNLPATHIADEIIRRMEQ
jgi:hypothetical protein